MPSILRNSAFAAVLIGALASSTLSQGGPLLKRINYSINVGYGLRTSDRILPPGDYVLRQISANDLNLFWLYAKNMSHGPIATIRTTQIDYSATSYPEHTEMLIEMVESNNGDYPVLRGWTIPGQGWQIIGVVAKNNKTLRGAK